MAGYLANVTPATISNYMRGAIDATYRDYKLLAMLRAKGRISFNNAGTAYEWVVKYRQADLNTYEDGTGKQFGKVARHKRAKLTDAHYYMPEFISRIDRLANSGPEALVDLFGNKVDTLAEEMPASFHSQFYNDGNAAGFESSIQGFESFFSISGAATNGFVGINNDTYAGLSTALGAAGGTWSLSGGVNTWPIGFGSPQYDYFTPMVCLYDGTGWSISTATWAARAEEVMTFATTHSARNIKGKKGQTDVILLTPELWRQYKNLVRGKERIVVERGSATSLVSMGFTDTMNIDGFEVTAEFGVPAGVGYGLNFDSMELKSKNPDLFNFYGPFQDPHLDGDCFSMDFDGQLIVETPRDQFKLRTVA